MKRYLPFIIVAVVAIATLGSGAMLYRAKLPHLLTISEEENVSGKSDAESMHIRGNPEASVTLEEFGDFECPSCAKLATFLDQVIKDYHPRVRLIFRNFPLPNHLFARNAALAAEAAGLQGRYWEMHDMLYREQPVWSSSKSANDARTLFISYAETLELDLDRFKRDMDSDKARERIESDQARAKSVGVKTAPSLFVDRREMGPNDRTPEGVRRLVDEALKAKSSTSEKK